MSPQPDSCPGCGAHVHPEDLQCPACGTPLHPPRRALPLLVGVLGVVFALAAGAGVWVLLSPSKGPGPQAAAPPAAVTPAPAPAPEPPPTPVLVPPAPTQMPALPTPVSAPPATPSEAAGAPAETLPLPTLRPGTPPTPSDPASRREFAKTTQANFVQNGLDMVVTTSGDTANVLSMKFNFPARTAVELIVAGPFPRQCKTRGFQKVVFIDPTGASWTYDVETEKLSSK